MPPREIAPVFIEPPDETGAEQFLSFEFYILIGHGRKHCLKLDVDYLLVRPGYPEFTR